MYESAGSEFFAGIVSISSGKPALASANLRAVHFVCHLKTLPLGSGLSRTHISLSASSFKLGCARARFLGHTPCAGANPTAARRSPAADSRRHDEPAPGHRHHARVIVCAPARGRHTTPQHGVQPPAVSGAQRAASLACERSHRRTRRVDAEANMSTCFLPRPARCQVSSMPR